jgi:hypothetical protein
MLDACIKTTKPGPCGLKTTWRQVEDRRPDQFRIDDQDCNRAPRQALLYTRRKCRSNSQ